MEKNKAEEGKWLQLKGLLFTEWLRRLTCEEGPEVHAETSYQDSEGKDFLVEGTASAKTKVETCWAYV